jgi:hypothetical protein
MEFMTTAAERLLKKAVSSTQGEEGQSVLEFLLMLPVMMGLVVLMTRANSAIQVSLVDQQYARAQALFLAFNSPVFPQLAIRIPNLDGKQYNQVVMGVSDNVTNGTGETYVPKATVQNVARNAKVAALGNNDPQTEPNPDQGGLRALVRVRNTVSLCSQTEVVQAQGAFVPVLPVSVGTNGMATAEGPSALTDSPQQFAWCRGVMMDE